MEGSSSRNDSLVWTDAQLDHLINLLVEQSRLPGMKSGANLKPKAYKAIERQMLEMFGPEFKVEKIKNKLKSTKADYNVCRQILSTSGFGWDPTKQCVHVENEVWAEYIQKFPDWRKFKEGQKWKHYRQLDEVYGHQSTVNGIGSFTCSSINRSDDLETNQAPETPITHTPDLGFNVDENVSFAQMLNDESPLPSPSHGQQDSQHTASESRTTNSSNKRARLSMNYEYGTILHQIADSFRTMINTSTYCCLNKCLDLLQEMLESGEIDADMHLKATMLMEQPNKPVVFLKLLPTQRVPWLLANVNHP